MARWIHHFKKLQAIANSIVSGLPKSNPSVSEPESFEMQWDAKHSQTAKPSCHIETELLKGIETSVQYLEVNPAGWCYKSIPVFLFGLKLSGDHSRQDKAFFYHQVHLNACCDALKKNDHSVWVASDSHVLKPWQTTQAFEVCHRCLMMTSYQNYRSLSSDQQAKLRMQFEFSHYVKWHSTEYFSSSNYSLWVPGQKLKRFNVGGNNENEKCHNCRWPLPANSENIILDASLFDFDAPTCVCCIDNSPKVAVIKEDLLLAAYAKRYWQWRNAYIEEQGLGSIASQNIKFSWAQLAYHFPRKWQPLIEVLKQFEPADIYCLAENGYALLAWPRLRRAIVLNEKDKKGFPGGWEIWTYTEVLENL